MYLVSASTIRSASSLADRREIPKDKWIFVPWGNSYERGQILAPFIAKGISKKQMLGYFTEGEIFDLTGSF
jgi:hypothetical protein